MAELPLKGGLAWLFVSAMLSEPPLMWLLLNTPLFKLELIQSLPSDFRI
jgi:hypothetical protein